MTFNGLTKNSIVPLWIVDLLEAGDFIAPAAMKGVILRTHRADNLVSVAG